MENSIQFMKIKLIFSQLWFYSLLFLAITMFSFNCSNVTYSGSASSKLAKRLTTLLPMTSLKTSSANKRNYDHILMGDLGWWVRDNGRKQKIDKRNMANLWNWMIKKIDCRQIIGHSVITISFFENEIAIYFLMLIILTTECPIICLQSIFFIIQFHKLAIFRLSIFSFLPLSRTHQPRSPISMWS